MLRLVAYAPFANRLFLPSRYLLAGGPLFKALQHARVLLEERLVAVDIHADADSFAELACRQRLGRPAEQRGAWLDAHVRLKRPFQVQPLQARYHAVLAADLDVGGGLRHQLVGRQPKPDLLAAIARARKRFATVEGSRRTFVETVARTLQEAGLASQRRLLERWAAMRYYTVPFLMNTVRTRELPRSAFQLLHELGGPRPPRALRADAQPAHSAENLARVLLPGNLELSRAGPLAVAALQARADIPHARRAFAEVVAAADRVEMTEEVSEVLRQTFAAQLHTLHRARGRGRRNDLVADLLGGTLSGIGLPLPPEVGAGLGGAATVIELGRHALSPGHESRIAPWPVACEHLTRLLQDV